MQTSELLNCVICNSNDNTYDVDAVRSSSLQHDESVRYKILELAETLFFMIILAEILAES